MMHRTFLTAMAAFVCLIRINASGQSELGAMVDLTRCPEGVHVTGLHDGMEGTDVFEIEFKGAVILEGGPALPPAPQVIILDRR